MKKKFKYLILAGLMVLSIMPASAFAAGETNDTIKSPVMYLDKTYNNDVMETVEKFTHGVPISVTAADAIWGAEGESNWYIADSNLSLASRPEIKGDVHLILKNGITLTASSGITLRKNNSLTIYAQSDDEAVMGKLVGAATGGDAVIGGMVGSNAIIDVCGADGGDECGSLNLKGGKLFLYNEAGVGIGGGNGGNGGSSLDTQSFSSGAYGGNGNDVTVYGGIITIHCKGAPCIGGGNGGNGGSTVMLSSGRPGGDGGNAGNIIFLGGIVDLQSDASVCVGGGNGGKGAFCNGGQHGGDGGCGGTGGTVIFKSGEVRMRSNLRAIGGGKGGPGGEADDPPCFIGPVGVDGAMSNITFGENIIAKAGEDETLLESISDYNAEKYLFVLHTGSQNIDSNSSASIITSGNLAIVASIAVAVVITVVVVIIINKKKVSI